MSYVPSRYIVKECVQTCTESSGSWGGSSLEVNCCSTTLCNNALRIYSKNRFFFTIAYIYNKILFLIIIQKKIITIKYY